MTLEKHVIDTVKEWQTKIGTDDAGVRLLSEGVDVRISEASSGGGFREDLSGGRGIFREKCTRTWTRDSDRESRSVLRVCQSGGL